MAYIIIISCQLYTTGTHRPTLETMTNYVYPFHIDSFFVRQPADENSMFLFQTIFQAIFCIWVISLAIWLQIYGTMVYILAIHVIHVIVHVLLVCHEI